MRDPLRGGVDFLTFPNDDNAPAVVRQAPLRVLIATLVACDLWTPILKIRLSLVLLKSVRVTVPVATPHVYGDPVRAEHDVDSTPGAGHNRSMQPVPISRRVEQPP